MLCSSTRNLLLLPVPAYLSSRPFSRYAPIFIHPIFRDADQERLKKEDPQEWERHKYLPIRPLNNNQNASVFYDRLVEKFINHVMEESNKGLARDLVEKAFEEVKRIQLKKAKTDPSVECNPYKLIHQAISNGRPLLQTVPIKRGGHTYQVPVPIRERAQVALAMKWLMEAGNEKPDEERFFRQLAREIIDAGEGVGKVVKRKQDLHRQCEANRAYAHYRWS